MSDLAKLEDMYNKEVELFKKHKEKADNLKKRIDEEKGQVILRSVKNMNLSPKEFKQFQKALENEANVRMLIHEMGGGDVTNGNRDGKDIERESQ